MNLTLIAFAPGYTRYYNGGDVDYSYGAEWKILHPDSSLAAAQLYADLQIAESAPRPEDRRGWEISILFDGRESGDSEGLSAIEEQITNLAYDLRESARAKLAEQARIREAKARERQLAKDAETAKRRAEQQEEKDRKELARLKAKYESSF